MNFLDYLHLLRRHMVGAISLTILVVALVMLLACFKNTAPYETTVFISIGNGSTGESKDKQSYENIQASDQFSETVQGWFKNPEFQKRIRETGTISEMSARKQEKQNILVTFASKKAEDADIAGETLKTELKKEIATYNSATNGNFMIAIFSVDTEKKPLSLPLFFFISLIGGMLLSSFALYGYEYLFEKISSPSQASELLKKDPIEEIPSLENKKNRLEFLTAYLKGLNAKNIQVIGVGADTQELAKSLEHLDHGKNILAVIFPHESGKIKPDNHHIVVCRLGKTTMKDIQKILKILPASFDLIIVEA